MDYLAVWDELRTAIEKAHSVSDLKDVRNRAQLMRHALRMAGESEELIRKAVVVQLRAERRAGEILLSSPKQGPGDYRRSNGCLGEPLALSFSEQGVAKAQAFKWQKIASIPEPDFEDWLANAEELSSSGALKLATARKDWSDYHPATRLKQALHDDDVHHPLEKIQQIREFLPKRDQPYKVLELFAGGEDGNLSRVYREYGTVDRFDKKLGTGDSFIEIHKLIHERRLYNIIDIDPYGGPERLFPHVYRLTVGGFLFVTCPKPGVNVTNRMNLVHNRAWWGAEMPSEGQVVDRIISWGLCLWRDVELLDTIEFANMWRFAFKVKKVKATEYVGIDLRRPATAYSSK